MKAIKLFITLVAIPIAICILIYEVLQWFEHHL